MLYTNGADIDLSKYKRFIVIGCSFTSYRWATWADIIAQQMPQAEYINLGKSGAGQLYITTQLSQALTRHNIGPDDLVAIMWSTFYREDRYYAERGWHTPGNIYTQQDYPAEWVDQYVDRRGYMIRDLGLIDNTLRMLEHAPFDSFCAMGLGIDDQNWYAGMDPDQDEQQLNLREVADFYCDIHSKMLPCLKDTEYPLGWSGGYEYQDTWGWNHDYHPTAPRYLSYLEKCGFQFSDSVKQYVDREHEFMQAVKHIDELRPREHHPDHLL